MEYRENQNKENTSKYTWTYKTYGISKGKYDGAIVMIPEFFENPELYSFDILCISKSTHLEYLRFYTDVLSYIFGISVVKNIPFARKINYVHEISQPRWMIKYFKKSLVNNEYYKKFRDDQANQLAILIGLQCVGERNLTPHNNLFFDTITNSKNETRESK